MKTVVKYTIFMDGVLRRCNAFNNHSVVVVVVVVVVVRIHT